MDSVRNCLLGPGEHTEVICLENRRKLWGRVAYRCIEGNAKCCHLTNLPVKGLCGRCLPEFIDRRDSQSYWYFGHSFMNFCPSIVLSGQLPPFPVSKYDIYRQCVAGRWGGVLSPCWRPYSEPIKLLSRPKQKPRSIGASDRLTPAAKSLDRSVF
jgi:hypothetical protein